MTTKLGPTGQFPQGKLNPTDEGELTFAVGVENGKVGIAFGAPVAWLAMDADKALALASSIIGHAMAIKRAGGVIHASDPS